MNISRQGRKVAWLSSTLAGVALLLAYGPAQADRPPGQVGVDWGTPAGQECVDCHMTENPGLYWEWNLNPASTGRGKQERVYSSVS